MLFFLLTTLTFSTVQENPFEPALTYLSGFLPNGCHSTANSQYYKLLTDKATAMKTWPFNLRLALRLFNKSKKFESRLVTNVALWLVPLSLTSRYAQPHPPSCSTNYIIANQARCADKTCISFPRGRLVNTRSLTTFKGGERTAVTSPKMSTRFNFYLHQTRQTKPRPKQSQSRNVATVASGGPWS
jgi:hypothetical protein